MDRTGGLKWQNPEGAVVEDDKESELFLESAKELRVTNSVGDILAVKRSHTQRQFLDKKKQGLSQSMSTPQIGGPPQEGGGKSGAKAKSRTGYSNLRERPPSKQEIQEVEQALLTQARTIIVMDDLTDEEALEKKTAYHPQAVDFKIEEERLIKMFGQTHMGDISRAKWLRDLIKSNVLWNLCEEKSSNIADMVSVTSGDLGAALRKLRSVYRQTNDQIMTSFRHLHRQLAETSKSLAVTQGTLDEARVQIDEKGSEVDAIVEERLAQAMRKLQEEAAIDQQKLLSTQNELRQTNLALKNLNVIFKTMQTDSAQVEAIHMLSQNERLQRELAHATEQNAEFERTKAALDEALLKVDSAQRANRIQEHEIKGIRAQLAKRDETIASLMEKDAIRQAEIEQLQKIASLMNEKEDEDDFVEPPTSVLCVKCKKGLDDLSNIREAVTGTLSTGRLPCQSYRILLPNIGGRRPNRTNSWIRACMRAIIVSKMREDVILSDFRGRTTRLPEYTYSWFEREQVVVAGTEGVPQSLTPAELAKRLDEDRWGFYYGVKALSRDDPEATLFWSLLDEAQGEDGLSFVLHILSFAISLGGRELWSQYGSLLTGNATVTEVDPTTHGAEVHDTPAVVWLHIKIAKDVIRSVFKRGMEKQVKEAVEAVEAMCERPGETSSLFGTATDAGSLASASASVAPVSANVSVADGGAGGDEGGAADGTAAGDATDGGLEEASQTGSIVTASKEPTHVNLYAYLRFMLGKYQTERTQRGAAVKLMFEAAAVGALSPHGDTDPIGDPRGEQHVEFPQFQAVLRTLNPHASVLQMAHMYSLCYEAGGKKVASKVFLDVADKLHIFSDWMELSPLPLMSPLTEDGAPEAVQGEYSHAYNPTQLEEGRMKKAEANVRVALGSLVHRSFQSLRPYIIARMTDLPDAWRSILQRGVQRVQDSLKDTWLKMRKKDGGFGLLANSENMQPRTGMNMDGLQPYVHYQRLLSSLLLIDGFNSNPILPSELIRYRDVAEPETAPGADGEPPQIGLGATPISLDIRPAQRLLETLERSVITLTQAKSIKHMPYKSRYFTYDKTRRYISAMRVQHAFRAWSADGNHAVPLPRILRRCMRAGYLGGRRVYNAPSTTTDERLGKRVRTRRVIQCPWWAQAFVAEVFALKMNFDATAHAAGRAPLSLPQATTTLALVKVGSHDVAERQIHDFFVSCKTYQESVPRLKMFMAFIGFASDMDKTIMSVLSTETAVARYLDLLYAVHMVLVGHTGKQDSAGEKTSSTSAIIHELFQSNGSEEEYATEVDIWRVPLDVLEAAVRHWMVGIDTTDIKDGDTIGETFEACTRQVVVDDENRASVDDFLWIIMNQWAKLMVPLIRKVNDRMSRLEKKMMTPVSVTQDGKGGRLRPGPPVSDPTRLLTSEELNAIMQSIHTTGPNVVNDDVAAASSAYMKLVSDAFTKLHTACSTSGVMAVNQSSLNTSVKDNILQLINGRCPSRETGNRLSCHVAAATHCTATHAMARVLFSTIHDGLGLALDEMQQQVVDKDKEENTQGMSATDSDQGPFARAVTDDSKNFLSMRTRMLKLESVFAISSEEDRGNRVQAGFSQLMREPQTPAGTEEVCALLRGLLSATDEAIRIRTSALPARIRVFPLDEWLAGSKLDLEKAKIYAAKLR